VAASSIVDYGRDQSQLMTLRDGGLDRLFAIDWLPATDETADWSIEGYVAVLEEAVQFLGGRVNLVVNTLTVGGAPTDTHADRSAVQEWTRLLARRNELAVYRTLVRVGGGVQGREASTNRVHVAGIRRCGRAPDGPSRQHPRSRLRDSAHRLHQLVRMDTDLPGAF